MKKKILSALLTLSMLLSVPSGAAFAETAAGDGSAVVSFTAQAENAFLCAPQEEIDVEANTAESYGYEDNVSDGVSALDVLVKAHELIFGDGFNRESASDFLKVDKSFVKTIFGVQTSNSGFTVNGKQPHDDVLIKSDYGDYYTGYTIDTAKVSSGDFVEFFIYQDSWSTDNYIWFEKDGEKLDSLSVTCGEKINLTLKGYPIGWYGCNTEESIANASSAVCGAQLCLADPLTGEITDIKGAVSDDSGSVTVEFPQPGDMLLSAYMPSEEIEDNYAAPVIMPVLHVSAEAPRAPKQINIGIDTPGLVDGSTLVCVSDDEYQLKAYDENGDETPVIWDAQDLWAASVSEEGLLKIKSASSGSSSYVTLRAVSVIDESVNAELRLTITGFMFGSYAKNTSVILSEDGQSAKTVSISGGYSGHTIWSYDEDGIRNIAEPAEPVTNGSSIKFNVFRPGTFEVAITSDFDEALTDSASVTVYGVAVESIYGERQKTYLDKTSGNPNPTVQLAAYCEEGKSICSWTSSDDGIASVDENGFVTAKSIGTALITAVDNEGAKGGIKVVVSDSQTPAFESLEFLTSAFTSGTWVKDTTFSPAKLEYNLDIKAYSTSKLTLQATTLYNTEKYNAYAHYTDINGEERTVGINSGKITYIENIPFDISIVIITIADKENSENKTEYKFSVTRPRDTTKTIKNTSGISVTPGGRSLYGTKYNGYAEGTMLRADENGVPSSGTGVASGTYNYRTYLQNSDKFSLSFTGTTVYEHMRFSTDGESWTELPQGGGTTDIIQIPQGETSACRVILEIIDDKAYNDNIANSKDGFDGEKNTYVVWVENASVNSESAKMLMAETQYGDWYPAFSSTGQSFGIVISSDAQTLPQLSFTVSENASVSLGAAFLEADENGVYTLPLKTTAQEISVTSAGGTLSNSYKFTCKKKSKFDVPDRICDFLCINSQYTNGVGAGNAANPEGSLCGTLTSLGGFGGYITYYYENPLTDNPNNKYGVDFYVYGNAGTDTSSSTKMSFFEPGQVWVSEDGESWYALAGSAHYDDGVDWNYTVSYQKTASGKTAWTDSLGNSNDGSAYSGLWPSKDIYYLNSQAGEDLITLSGVLLPAANSSAAVCGIAVDAYPVNWGYADVFANGTQGEDVNPYSDNSSHAHKTNGFDLAWAVDSEGNPIDVSDMQFHYVKVQTASNIWHPSFGEKSTEVSLVTKTAPQEGIVGKTSAPSAFVISDGADSKTVVISDDKRVYDVNIGDMKYISVSPAGVDEDANIYVNNTRICADEKASGFKVTKEKGETLVRVIVQSGEKEPLVYLMRLTGGASESNEPIEGLKVNAGGNVRTLNTTDGKSYFLTVGYRISEVQIAPVVKDGVGYTVNGAAPSNSYSLEYGENVFEILSVGDNAQEITLTITRESAPVSSGDSISVYFTLYGDTKHGGDGELHTYKGSKSKLEKWIDTKQYTLPSGSTVLDVFEAALKEAGLPYVNADGNYISEVNGLCEFDNGPLSGWMYLINGVHPSCGVAEQGVKSGDRIIFHYTDDYTAEQGSEKWLRSNTSSAGKAEASVDSKDAETEITAATEKKPVSNPFADVSDSDWFCKSVISAYEKGLMKGTSDAHFSPHENITRAMLVTILHRMENEADAENAKFTDVAQDAYYAKAVAWAYENKIIVGVTAYEFAPDDFITREQLITVLYRYAKYKEKDISPYEDTRISSFDDFASVSEYAVPAVKWACGAGIVKGTDDGRIEPSGFATRAEAAALLERI